MSSFGPIVYDGYMADNTTVDLVTDASKKDGVFERGHNRLFIRTTVESANSDTIATSGEQEYLNGSNLIITSGPADSECLLVTNSTYNSCADTTTYTLNGNFSVIPTAGTDFDITSMQSNLVFYHNTVNWDATDPYTPGTPIPSDPGHDYDGRSEGFQPFQGGYQMVFDDNEVNNTY